MDKKGYDKNYYQKNIERLKGLHKIWYRNNREKIIERSKKRHKDNPEYNKIYYQKHKDKMLEQRKKYYQEHKEAALKYDREYHREHKEELNKYKRDKHKIDLKFNLNMKMANAIGKSLRGNKKGRCWEGFVDYTLNDLIKRLKKTMPKGYTWNDFLESKLHLDHIIPMRVFNFTKPEHIDFKRCWSLKNLRLLPAKENLSKGSKLKKPFQLALKV